MKQSTDNAQLDEMLRLKKAALLSQVAEIELQLATSKRTNGGLEEACVAANGDAALEAEIDEWQAFDESVVE